MAIYLLVLARVGVVGARGRGPGPGPVQGRACSAVQAVAVGDPAGRGRANNPAHVSLASGRSRLIIRGPMRSVA